MSINSWSFVLSEFRKIYFSDCVVYFKNHDSLVRKRLPLWKLVCLDRSVELLSPTFGRFSHGTAGRYVLSGLRKSCHLHTLSCSKIKLLCYHCQSKVYRHDSRAFFSLWLLGVSFRSTGSRVSIYCDCQALWSSAFVLTMHARYRISELIRLCKSFLVGFFPPIIDFFFFLQIEEHKCLKVIKEWVPFC